MPGFARWAEAFGARGFRIERAEDAQCVAEQAMGVDGPALVEVCCDPDVSVQSSLERD